MARQAYHITSGAPDSDHIKIVPSTWYNVGAVQSVYAKSVNNGVVYVNTAEEEASALSLMFPDDAALEDEGRTLYVKGSEGQKIITDDGA